MKLPNHIAFIMDGNGRWAKQRGLSRKFGHAEGVKALEKIVDEVSALHIPYMTFFAFSTENWNRPKDEVDALMNLIRDHFADYFMKLSEKGIKVNILGDVSVFPEDIRCELIEASLKVPETTLGTVNVALNYGGRQEIITAVNKAVENGNKVTDESFRDYLYTKDFPDPDLIIRTSGEMRISNFLLYQSAYSELIFTKTLWPDFGKKELFDCLNEFSERHRRYGKVE